MVNMFPHPPAFVLESVAFVGARHVSVGDRAGLVTEEIGPVNGVCVCVRAVLESVEVVKKKN